METINKENMNQYLLPFTNWLLRFIPRFHLTPQGLLYKQGKNDILIWDESFQLDWESVCVKMMLDRTTEPDIVYGDAFDSYLVRIWNLRLTRSMRGSTTYTTETTDWRMEIDIGWIYQQYRYPIDCRFKYHPQFQGRYWFTSLIRYGKRR